uniref:Uncharacterized protein n=1 Tax=Arundo donax TaxID=35708 RepID=A0A0A9GKN3_ARUDO
MLIYFHVKGQLRFIICIFSQLSAHHMRITKSTAKIWKVTKFPVVKLCYPL